MAKSFLKKLCTPKSAATSSLIFLLLALVLLIIDSYQTLMLSSTFPFWPLLIFVQLILAIIYFCLALKQRQPSKTMNILIISSLLLLAVAIIHSFILSCIEASFLFGNEEIIFASPQTAQVYLWFNLAANLAMLICFLAMASLYILLVLRKHTSLTNTLFCIFLVFFAILILATTIPSLCIDNFGFEMQPISQIFFMLPMASYAALCLAREKHAK